jgi:serine/threonine-protein kinase RsbW
MNQRHAFKPLLRLSHRDGPYIQLELSLRSEVSAISSFTERVVHFIRRCRCTPGNEEDIEVGLREALVNAVVHGNHQDPEKQVYVSCRCGIGEVSIVVRDEGQGFDIGAVADPTAPENIESSHGRGIYLMKAVMDEVRFERGGAVVYMRKSARKPAITLRKLG